MSRIRSRYFTVPVGKILMALLYGRSAYIYRKGPRKVLIRHYKLAQELRITRSAYHTSIETLVALGVITGTPRVYWGYTAIELAEPLSEKEIEHDQGTLPPKGQEACALDSAEESEGEVAAVPGR